MRMSEKCRNNNNQSNSDNPLTSRRTDGGKKSQLTQNTQRGRKYLFLKIKILFGKKKEQQLSYFINAMEGCCN